MKNGTPYAVTDLKTFTTNPAQVIMTDMKTNPIIAVRDFGQGHVAEFAMCYQTSASCILDPAFQQLIVNAITW